MKLCILHFQIRLIYYEDPSKWIGSVRDFVFPNSPGDLVFVFETELDKLKFSWAKTSMRVLRYTMAEKLRIAQMMMKEDL